MQPLACACPAGRTAIPTSNAPAIANAFISVLRALYQRGKRSDMISDPKSKHLADRICVIAFAHPHPASAE
jgi:hypothetical protein